MDPAQHLGLARMVAAPYVPAGEHLEDSDAYSEALIGLVKACRNYDPERGYAFSTYAARVMRGEMAWRYKQRLRQSRVYRGPSLTDADMAIPAVDFVEQLETQRELMSLGLATQSLTPRQREVIAGRMQGQTYEVIAQQLGVTKQCCQQTEATARHRLRTLIGTSSAPVPSPSGTPGAEGGRQAG